MRQHVAMWMSAFMAIVGAEGEAFEMSVPWSEGWTTLCLGKMFLP